MRRLIRFPTVYTKYMDVVEIQFSKLKYCQIYIAVEMGQ